MDKKTEESFYVSDTPDLSELKSEFDSDSFSTSLSVRTLMTSVMRSGLGKRMTFKSMARTHSLGTEHLTKRYG
jgi:hypothetical protein